MNPEIKFLRCGKRIYELNEDQSKVVKDMAFASHNGAKRKSRELQAGTQPGTTLKVVSKMPRKFN